MRIVSQSEFFNSYALPPSRLGWAARRAREGIGKVEPAAPPEIGACNEGLIAMTEHYAERHRAWQTARRERAAPELALSDNKLDKSFSNFVSRARMEVEDHGKDSVRAKAAQKLLDGPLNVEVFAVTNTAREDQEAILRSILNDLEASYAQDIEACGLSASFDVLQADFKAFAEAMSQAIKSEAAPTTEELQQLAADISSKSVELIHRVNGAYPTTSEEDRKNRSLILGPFALQNDRAAAFYRRNRGQNTLPDVDLDTGVDVVVTDENAQAPVGDVSEPANA
ncbi:hypothetical protein EA187_08710 [Lujinxingia sediminis]|uniref:Uncharacterized protein n=1 Tax=Lujinxingia sediminis TaxID=2480984 RepID=A0ABY0CU26_9DELT|nr:DUF6261 family protein [Lujinxingia sediminis]RVU45829.1 hypothetical protein EA187_08710 [Lujinxingia sediminis]